MRAIFRILLIALLPLMPVALPGTAAAAEQATLVADSIYLTGNDLLTAEGAVEAYYQGTRVQAAKIVYDATTDRMAMTGPISLTDQSGTVFVADSAELSRDLSEGILKSARMVMDEQLQLAAAELTRIGGRYTRLDKVVASACQVCPSHPTPLWEIRARRIVHDQQEQQIYFDDAQFRVVGVPVFYLPRLRMPDPTLKRATGFLRPDIRTTSTLGPGIKLPYFVVLGDSRDVTLTPYFATRRTATLGARYREALRNGSIVVDASVSNDSIRPGETRGYLFGTAAFNLPDDFALGLQLQTVSDNAYLLDYGVGDTDWLSSGVSLDRTRRNEYISFDLFKYRSLRDRDDNATLPNLTAEFDFQRRFSPGVIGGEGKLSFAMRGHRRSSTVDYDANGDGVTDGRDMSRATLGLDWRKSLTMTNGMVLSGATNVTAEVYSIAQDNLYPGSVARILPQGAVQFRWPWVRAEASGGSQVIEPVAQLILAPDTLRAVPNDDSAAALDEGNLFAFSRFSGADQRELGNRVNLGLSWTRFDAAGWTLGATAGRVMRARDLRQFTSGSGLDGRSSDWLVSAHFTTPSGISIQNRALFDNGFDFSQNDLMLAYAADRYNVNAGYLWLIADPAIGRKTATSELVLNASWDVTEGWRGKVAGNYDFNIQRATRADFGLSYRNECASVDLYLSRRFTSSTIVTASTDFNLSVSLVGFGAGADGRSYRKSCAG